MYTYCGSFEAVVRNTASCSGHFSWCDSNVRNFL